MSKHTDISTQIQKYLNGELNARAMHQLEREAQNDPFLMDALDGYAHAGKSQQNNLADITARLQQRTQPKVKRLIPWKAISIAASVVVVLGIGVVLLNNNKDAKKPESKIAYLEKAPPAPITQDSVAVGDSYTPQASTEAAEREIEIAKRKQYASAKREKNRAYTEVYDKAVAAAAENEVMQKPMVRQGDTTSLEERVAMGFFSSPEKKAQPETSAVVAIASDTLNRLLQGRVAGVQVDTRLKSSIAKNISGIVMDGRYVLPGVTVNIKDTKIGTVTDANGRFTLPVVPDKSVLSLGYVGYDNKQIKVSNQDSLVIAMEPNHGALNEVVVVGYGTAKKQKVKPYPVTGQKQFEEYLQQNAVSPDGKTGTVKISFVVSTDGTISDIKIHKGLSEETNNKAISLIKDGPEWESGNSGKPEKVNVSIKFTAKR